MPDGTYDNEASLVAVPHGPAIYPEYLTDMNIYFCPSDQESPEDYLQCPEGQWCTQDASHPNFGKLDPKEFDDRSYVYYGWVAENDVVFTTMLIAAQANVSPEYGGSLSNKDSDLDVNDLVINYLDSNIWPTVYARYPEYSDARAIGNGGTNRILRLKEGVERFMITDINNPAGSAMAQSTIPVMWDVVDENVKNFHHIPGGANVLYMDGHVEFLKYPQADRTKVPVTKLAAMWGRGW
jgi:prepilin-type processing-associated H-X9-DG protein